MDDSEILTVTELTQRLKVFVESGFPLVRVEGEISNLSRATSGHSYFTLKDETAQIRAVLWRSAAARVRFELHDGLHVVAAGPLDLYAARGTYQIVVQQIAPQGIGPLELAFRQLYEKLAAEGLFRPERKRNVPRFPRRIGLITSPAGAAVRDMIQVIARRWPLCRVTILPVAVQGPTASTQIAAALAAAPRIANLDVVIVGRGGGSLEDLWAFNEERVARAIANCPIPVVSAVGHEIDVTIADLVADRRALSPSEAGEIVVPDWTDVLAELKHIEKRLVATVRHGLTRLRHRLDGLAQSRPLCRPLDGVHDRQRALDELAGRLQRSVRQRVTLARSALKSAAGTLDALSPLKVLSRGYSLTRSASTGEIVRRSAGVKLGERIETILIDGQFSSVVDRLEP